MICHKGAVHMGLCVGSCVDLCGWTAPKWLSSACRQGKAGEVNIVKLPGSFEYAGRCAQ